MSSTQKLFAGLILATVLIFVAVHFAKSENNPTGTCALTAAAFEVVAAGVHEGSEYEKIAASAGVGVACEAAIKKWVETPNEAVDVGVNGQPGTSLTGQQVDILGGQPQPSDRLSYCLSRYNVFTEFGKECLSGEIN
jgi:hypothetical protein